MSAQSCATDDGYLAETLKALGHPARLEIVRLTGEGEMPVGELAERLDLPQAVTSQHLRVLRDCDLVTVRIDGNRRFYRVNFERAATLRDFLDEIWAQGLADLKRAAEEEHSKRKEES